MAQRAILHMDLDAFFVSVEQLKDASLKGKPVIVGGSSDRGVVAACSYEARKFGIHSAMPAKQARKLCPQAIFLKGSYEEYSTYSRMVTQILQEHAPLLEKASVDEFYVDMTGMERFYGCMLWATDIKKRIVQETGLSISFGLSSNKTVSKMAVRQVKPDGQIQVEYGEEKAYLAPFDVGKIPMVGPKTAQLLRRYGIDTVGELADTPPKKLEALLGKYGLELWHRANGRDDSPVVPHHQRKSLSEENTFRADTDDRDFLHKEIVRIVSSLGYDLRRHGETAGCLTLKLRYANFDTLSRQVTLPTTTSDALMIAAATQLFEQAYDGRGRVRLLGVRLSKLGRGGVQLQLFDGSARQVGLHGALDQIRSRFGMEAVKRAVL